MAGIVILKDIRLVAERLVGEQVRLCDVTFEGVERGTFNHLPHFLITVYDGHDFYNYVFAERESFTNQILELEPHTPIEITGEVTPLENGEYALIVSQIDVLNDDDLDDEELTDNVEIDSHASITSPFELDLDEMIKARSEVTFDGVLDDKHVHLGLTPQAFKRYSTEDMASFKTFNLDPGDVVIVDVRVVNLGKKSRSAWRVQDAFVLVDEQGNEYPPLPTKHFESDENFLQRHFVMRFGSWSDVPPLKPKIPVNGALAFLVPPDSEGRISIRPASLDDPERDDW